MPTYTLSHEGRIVTQRFVKAMNTIRTKYADNPVRAQYAIEGLFRAKFGDDISINDMQDMVRRGEFWRIAVQKNRTEHMNAQLRQKMLDEMTALYCPSAAGLQPF